LRGIFSKSKATKGGSEVVGAAEESKTAKATDRRSNTKAPTKKAAVRMPEATQEDKASKETKSKATKGGSEVLGAAEESKTAKATDSGSNVKAPTKKAAVRMPAQRKTCSTRYQHFRDDDVDADNNVSQAEVCRMDLLWDNTTSPKETEQKKKKEAKTEGGVQPGLPYNYYKRYHIIIIRVIGIRD
jgi:hypothetical protein